VSRVSRDIAQHESDRAERFRARLRVESLWSDAAARKFLDVLNTIEGQDKTYGAALAALNASFDEAKKYLGTTNI
jgi:hypothetical protein